MMGRQSRDQGQLFYSFDLDDAVLPEVWGGDGPVYDSREQAEYVLGLFMRKRATGPTYRSAADRGVMLGHERSI